MATTARAPVFARAPQPQRTPIRQQQAPFGSVNTAVPGRAVPPPLVRQRGPAVALEKFTGRVGLDPNVARALDQLQANLRAALGPIKALPHANGNLVENVTLVLGGASGSAPYTVLQHGLGVPFRGYHVLTVKGGSIVAHALVANPNPQGLPVASLDSAQIQLWTTFTPFGSAPVTADIFVYA